MDVGDTLVYSITNQPSWAAFNASTGELSGIPLITDVGIYNDIEIFVTDGVVSETMTAFSITVNEVNDAPSISGIPNTTVDEDSEYSFIPSAYDEKEMGIHSV